SPAPHRRITLTIIALLKLTLFPVFMSTALIPLLPVTALFWMAPLTTCAPLLALTELPDEVAVAEASLVLKKLPWTLAAPRAVDPTGVMPESGSSALAVPGAAAAASSADAKSS